MRVLVTGAAGFVGYAVATLLIEQGHQVTGLTRSGASALPKGVQRLQGDLSTPETLPRALAEVDGVCHLAGLTKVRESRTGPLDYWRESLPIPEAVTHLWNCVNNALAANEYPSPRRIERMATTAGVELAASTGRGLVRRMVCRPGMGEVRCVDQGVSRRA